MDWQKLQESRGLTASVALFPSPRGAKQQLRPEAEAHR